MNKDSLINTIHLYLDEQLIDLYESLTGLMTVDFLKQKELFNQVKCKVNNFLTNKVMFTLKFSSISYIS